MPEIFQLDFMVRAFIAGGFVGAISPLLGTFLVLRRLSLIADTLAHVALLGVAIGLLLDRYPVFFAVVAAAIGSLIIERLRSSNRFSSDAALALVLYTALATAVVIISLGDGFNVDLFSFLFGGIVTVGKEDVWAIGALGGVVVLVVVVLYRELVQSTFDPDLARTSGVRVGLTNTLLAVLTGIAIPLAMRVVGALLVGALIVIPVLASLQIARSFRATLLLSSILGVASVFSGLTISFYQDVAPGGAIVLTALGLLVLASMARLLRERA
ncbi:MAG: metal ABC transporter permease [Chloroflexi bacterium]|nr:metal ABC transporter permease [Chloroflexota bacterium]